MKSFLQTKPSQEKRKKFESLTKKALGIFFLYVLFIPSAYANTTFSEDKILQDLENIFLKIAQNKKEGKPDSTYFYEGFQPKKSKNENIIFASSDIESINTPLQKLDQKGRKTIIYMGYLWREYKGNNPNDKPSKAEMQQFANAQKEKINEIYKRLEEKFYLQTSNLSLHIVLRISVKVNSKNRNKSNQTSGNLWDWDIFFDSFYPRADFSNACKNSMMQTIREAIKAKQENALSKAPQKAMLWRANLLEQTIGTCPTEPILSDDQSKNLIALLNYIKSKTANQQQVLLHPAPETPAELIAENVKLGNTTYKKLQFQNYSKANPSFSKPEDYQLIYSKADKEKTTFQFFNKDSTDKVLFTLTLTDKEAESKKDSLKSYLFGDYTKSVVWGEKVSMKFINKLVVVCENLNGINPDYLMACMAFETGTSFDPCIKNSINGATGIIQFTKSNAEYLGTSTEKLCKMTAEEQLIYVEKHFKAVLGKNISKLSTIEDVYMGIFLPSMVGKANDTIIGEEGGTYYDLNKGLDINEDGKITKEEACSKVKKQLENGKRYKN